MSSFYCGMVYPISISYCIGWSSEVLDIWWRKTKIQVEVTTMDENQVLELVEFYEDMIEKQDEIIEEIYKIC